MTAQLSLLGDAALLTHVLAELERAYARGASQRGFCLLGGRRAFFKYGPIRGKGPLRHGLRRLLGISEVPRLQEFQNLAWLRSHGFRAPRPLLAGSFFEGWLPRFQFLYTAEIPGGVTLDRYLELASPAARRACLRHLGRELAALHARGFHHRDVFPRNLLVVPNGSRGRVHWLDAWRGGPRPGLRGAAHDLGCLLAGATGVLEAGEAELLLSCYRRARRRNGRRSRGVPSPARIERRRRTALERESRRATPAPPAPTAS